MRLAASLAVLLPSLGCAPARLLNALVPSDGLREEQAIAYGAAARQRLDLYRPDDDGRGARPVVVFFYGGSWQFGNRGDYRFVGQALAARGMLAVIPDYRVYPEARFPTFIEDGAAAVAWVHANAARFGGDPEQIYLMGHSAGAHIAAMLALDNAYLAAAGLGDAALAGLIGLAGPYDFLPLTDPTLQEVFAVPDLAVTQPVNQVTPAAPPAFLATGEDDVTVRPRNTLHLAQALERVGTPVEQRRYASIGHVGIVLALAAPFRWLAPVLDDVARFVGAAGDTASSRRETPPAGRAA
jgi:acetyl esterase/lipase